MRKKRKRTGIRLVFVVLIFCLIPGGDRPAFAQSTETDHRTGANSVRTIQGQVLSAQGAGVPGAVVLLKDGKTLQVRSYIAQAGGLYHFFGLSTDVNYTLRAENQDMTSKIQAVSVFDSKRVVKLNLKLTKKIKPYKN